MAFLLFPGDALDFFPLNGTQLWWRRLEFEVFVSVAPRNGTHQSPAMKRIKDDFIQDARAMPGIIRWVKSFAAILNWWISPNGFNRAAACDRKPAANPSHADFGPIFPIIHEIQPDRRTFRRHGIAAPHFVPGGTVAH